MEIPVYTCDSETATIEHLMTAARDELLRHRIVLRREGAGEERIRRLARDGWPRLLAGIDRRIAEIETATFGIPRGWSSKRGGPIPLRRLHRRRERILRAFARASCRALGINE